VNVLVEEVRGLQLGTGARTDDPAIRTPHSEFAFLKSLRRVAPDSKDWG